nr:ABC transporter permease [Brevibacillus reuszeri]
MLTRCISAEFLKLRHSRMWLILLVLPVISAFIGSANYYFNREVLQKGWYSLWTQVSLFYGEFFLPVLIAICCAYMCRLEHTNKNWNIVMTAPVPTTYVFLAKLTVISAFMLFVQSLFLFLFYVAGTVFKIDTPFPVEAFGWIMRGWLAAMSIAVIQLWLSIRIHSFATPIGISLCCVFLGLGMYIAKLGFFFPHSLLTIGMGVLSQESLTSVETIQFFVMSTGYLVIGSVLAIRWMYKTDVAT